MEGYQNYSKLSLSNKMNMLPVCGNEEKEGLVKEGLQPYLRGTNGDETWEMEAMNLQVTVRKMNS